MARPMSVDRQSRKAEAGALYEQGWTLSAISAHLMVPRTTVSTWVSGNLGSEAEDDYYPLLRLDEGTRPTSEDRCEGEGTGGDTSHKKERQARYQNRGASQHCLPIKKNEETLKSTGMEGKDEN